MIIKKIPEITNIGSFTNFSDNRLIYGKSNVIFALNGYGKTTLTSILKSLKQNNPNILEGRKNLKNSNADIKTVIETDDNKRFLFFNGSWRVGGKPLEKKDNELIIFDDEFINNNIFAERFEIEHKKALYRIIFGAKGIELSKELRKQRDKRKELIKRVSILENKLTPYYFNISDFIKLNKDDYDINTIKLELEKNEKEIKNNKNISEITKKNGFEHIPLITTNRETLYEILHKKVNSEAHLKAKKEIDTYKSEYFENGKEAEQFIKIGIQNHKTHCPFCHKVLDDEKLLEIYKDFFDKSYEDFKNSLEQEIKNFKSINLEVLLTKMNSIKKQNLKMLDEWGKHLTFKNKLLPIEPPTDLFSYFDKVVSICNEKIRNLNSEPDKLTLADYEKSETKLNSQVKLYNSVISLLNIEVENYKKSLSTSNLIELEKKSKRLKDIQKRFSDDIVLICNEINNKKKEVKIIDKSINDKQIELDEYSQNINKEYLDIINTKLKDDLLVTDFKLNSIKKESKATAKDAYVEIFIEILEKRVSLHSFKDNSPSFKNTLSRGDKNTLAFAFFLAFMEKKSNLENVCLIFDDPLSSLDENRQLQTAFIIMKLADKVSQTFILTHKKTFMRALYGKFNNNANYYEIQKSEQTGSIIVEYKTDNIILKNEYEKIVDKFNDYILNGTKSDLSIGNLQNDIRKVLEKVLKTKYYNILKDCSFSITSYNHLNNYFFQKNIITGNSKDELTDLAGVSNGGSHYQDYTDMNTPEIKTILKRTLKLIEKL